MNKVAVRDFMARKLITFRPDTNIYAAISTLVRNGISGAPVVGDQGELLGVLSEKDCLRVLANGVFHHYPAGPVSEYMTQAVMTVHPDTDMFTVADIFLKNIFRRLPVVEDGKVVGQISRRDVLRAVEEIAKQDAPTGPA